MTWDSAKAFSLWRLSGTVSLVSSESESRKRRSPPRQHFTWSDFRNTLDDTQRPPVRIFGSLFMNLFHPALTNHKQHNVGPKPHLFPQPSMPAVCCLARRAQAKYMRNPISWAFHGFTDVFFQLPAQTTNRVELEIATRSVSWAATAQWLASSREALGGMVLIGTKMSLFVLHHCSSHVCVSHPCTGTWTHAVRDSSY